VRHEPRPWDSAHRPARTGCDKSLTVHDCGLPGWPPTRHPEGEPGNFPRNFRIHDDAISPFPGKSTPFRLELANSRANSPAFPAPFRAARPPRAPGLAWAHALALADDHARPSTRQEIITYHYPATLPRAGDHGLTYGPARPPRHRLLHYRLYLYNQSGSSLEDLLSPRAAHSPCRRVPFLSGIRNGIRISWRCGMAASL
jgi:hypothetical protein